MEGDHEMSALATEGWLIAHPPPEGVPWFPSGHASGYAVDDWLKLPESGERIELIDGSFVVSPMASGVHALCAGRLRAILAAAAHRAGSGLEAVETINVTTGESGLIPDIAVLPGALLMSGLAVFPASEIAAVVEVVSPGPGNRVRDYEIKPVKYAAGGIPVFVRVDIDGPDIPCVEVLELGPDGYETVTQAKPGETVTLSEPFPVSFDPADLLYS
ncbi:Uma2 family endonuclease [Nonomuraea sp. NN258]|uniref:Uma2 family endonuclease n=1 Tax=Nonomuraea antri TaxID=2730852 RepID=UPI00156978F1|nr:Uma2 family endonuclease [Nonomuraea antri]NRQ39570.1 Uma2 family endonuclease [Nonomuraea antri]